MILPVHQSNPFERQNPPPQAHSTNNRPNSCLLHDRGLAYIAAQVCHTVVGRWTAHTLLIRSRCVFHVLPPPKPGLGAARTAAERCQESGTANPMGRGSKPWIAALCDHRINQVSHAHVGVSPFACRLSHTLCVKTHHRVRDMLLNRQWTHQWCTRPSMQMWLAEVPSRCPLRRRYTSLQ